MAQRVQVLLLDDLSGVEADETLSFGLDGVEFEIDLTGEHATELRTAMQQWTAHARRVGGRGKVQNINARRPRRQSDTDITAVRTWARENGHTVSDRGRISSEIMDAYKNRNKIDVPEAAVTSVEGETQQPKSARRSRGSVTA